MNAEKTIAMKFIFCLAALSALLWSLPQSGSAQSAAAGLSGQANEAYAEGDYERAIELYQQILAHDVIDGAILYNLGNAYFKTNQLGKSILFFERASRLLPRDRDVAANLMLVRELTVDKTAEESPPLPVRWITYPARTMNLNELTWVAFALYLATAFLVIAAIWIRPAGLRKKILVSGLIAVVLFLAAGASLLGNIYQQKIASRAIILESAADARSGPGQEYTKIFTLHEGTKVRIREQRASWYLIALPNGLGGWIPQAAAEII
jgi:tetratricopeptide (TPR) repeat protein